MKSAASIGYMAAKNGSAAALLRLLKQERALSRYRQVPASGFVADCYCLWERWWVRERRGILRRHLGAEIPPWTGHGPVPLPLPIMLGRGGCWARVPGSRSRLAPILHVSSAASRSMSSSTCGRSSTAPGSSVLPAPTRASELWRTKVIRL
jgi:hypothetical protein